MFFVTNHENIRRWKYSVEDNSITTKFFTGFWNWCADKVPYSVAPNTITLAAFLCLLQAYYLVETVVTPFRILGVIFLSLSYLTLDAIDGKHARNTGRSTPFGELWDHSFDAIGATFIALTACKIFEFSSFYTLTTVLATHFFFMHTHLKALKKDGVVVFNSLSGPTEALMTLLVLYLLRITHGLSVSPLIALLGIIIGPYLIWWEIGGVFKSESETQDIVGGITNLIVLKLLFLSFWYGEGQHLSDTFIIGEAMPLAVLSSDLILSKMAQKSVGEYAALLFFATIVNPLFGIVGAILYYTAVFCELKEVLDIDVF